MSECCHESGEQYAGAASNQCFTISDDSNSQAVVQNVSHKNPKEGGSEKNSVEREMTILARHKQQTATKTVTTSAENKQCDDTQAKIGSADDWENVTRQRMKQPANRHAERESRLRDISAPRTSCPSNRLRGAVKTEIQPFHLSGVSLECKAEDVIAFCRTRGVLTTGCFFLKPRIRHASLTAKMFVDSSASGKILASDFWPDHIVCRTWTTDPPRREPTHHLSCPNITGIPSISAK